MLIIGNKAFDSEEGMTEAERNIRRMQRDSARRNGSKLCHLEKVDGQWIVVEEGISNDALRYSLVDAIAKIGTAKVSVEHHQKHRRTKSLAATVAAARLGRIRAYLVDQHQELMATKIQEEMTW